MLKVFCLTSSLVFCLEESYYEIKEVYDEDVFEEKTDPLIYFKWKYPKAEMPIRVNTSLYLFSFGSIDEIISEYSIQLWLRVQWSDERLKIKPQSNKLLKLEGGQWHVDRIWTPSIHIPNNKLPNVLQDDLNPVLTHINSNGDVLVSKRILLNGFCEMNFRLYPLDVQLCDIEIESFDLSDNHLRLEWFEDQPFEITDEFSWNGFHLTNYTLTRLKTIYSHTGTYSRLMATFRLKRQFGHFMFDVYIPTIMFVISSWTSFWVEIPAAPARVTLGITTMLTLVTSAKTARDKLPRVSYIHALDIWILMCTFFIFASLVEYATVNFIYNKDKRSKKRKNNNNNNNQNNNQLKRTISTNSIRSLSSDSMFSTITAFKNDIYSRQHKSPEPLRRSISAEIKHLSDGGIELSVPNLNADNISIQDKTSVSDSKPTFWSRFMNFKFEKEAQDIAHEIDRKSRIIFPISFILVNIIYWTTLTILSHS